MLDLNEAITGRSSLREYTAQIVDEPIVYSLTSAAIQAPNAVNQQPWTFSLLRDEHILDHVSREAKLHIRSNIPASSHAGSLLSMVNDRDFHTLYHATTLIVMSAAA